MIKIYRGTEIKLKVEIKPEKDITIGSYDFVIELYCSPFKTARFEYSVEKGFEEKSNIIKLNTDDSSAIVLLDTNEVGIGDLKCKVTAMVPDSDFNDELRTEIVIADTGIQVVLY